MKAAVIEERERIKIKELPAPDLRAHEVLIKVKACGVCGTDIHIYKGEFPVKYPIVPGHEFSGIVEEVGEEVRSVRPGDRVTVDPNISCGKCYYCRTGRANFCENWQALGVTLPGGYAEYVKAPEGNVYKVPEGLTFEEAAFAEPVSCVVHGLKRARVRLGDTVAIFGLGPIGLIHLQLVKKLGATLVVGIDLIEDKLRLGERLGADHVVDASREDVVEEVKKVTGGRGVDLAIEASGNLKAFQQALRCLDYGGRLLVFGVAPQSSVVQVAPFEIYRREVSVLGSFINPYTTKCALDVIASGSVNIKALISKVYRLEEVSAAFKSVEEGRAVKVMLRP